MLILNFMMKEHENMKRFRTFRPLARKRLWCLFACHMLLFSNFTFSQEKSKNEMHFLACDVEPEEILPLI